MCGLTLQNCILVFENTALPQCLTHNTVGDLSSIVQEAEVSSLQCFPGLLVCKLMAAGDGTESFFQIIFISMCLTSPTIMCN